MQTNRPKRHVWTRFTQPVKICLALLFLRFRCKPKSPNNGPAISRGLLHPFDLQFPVFYLSPRDPVSVAQTYENFHITGQNGAGKSTGAGRTIIQSMMRAGYGAIVLCAKPGEYDLIKSYAAATGRLEHLIRFAPDEYREDGSLRWGFNFLAYEQKRGASQRGGGLTENIVRLFMTVLEASQRGEPKGGGGNERYFRLAAEQVMRNAIDTLRLARPHENLSLERMREIILSGPRSPEEGQSEAWQRSSACNKLMDEAAARVHLMSPSEKRDFTQTGTYWFQDFANLAPETRGSIISTFTTMADMFIRGPLAELFSTKLNIVPEVTHEGAIWCVDAPLKTYGHIGLCGQILCHYLWEQAAERRDLAKNPRPIFALMDEAHLFITPETVSFATTSRSAGCSNVLLSQTLSNYYWALGGEDKGKSLTDSLMAVMGTKIFHASSDPTLNEWAANYFAQSWQSKAGSSMGDGDGKQTTTVSTQQQRAYNVEPAEFLTLRKGGPQNNFMVDAIVGQGGRIWNASGTTILRTSFNQKGI